MKEPSEVWLDRHFAQQLVEYGEVFRGACKSDQQLIAYWLQVFKVAPAAQKWARNSLMLLVYGQLKEIGYLQHPFTDMSNVGRNLNHIVDSYSGLPINRSAQSPRSRKPTRVVPPLVQSQATPLPPKGYLMVENLQNLAKIFKKSFAESRICPSVVPTSKRIVRRTALKDQDRSFNKAGKRSDSSSIYTKYSTSSVSRATPNLHQLNDNFHSRGCSRRLATDCRCWKGIPELKSNRKPVVYGQNWKSYNQDKITASGEGYASKFTTQSTNNKPKTNIPRYIEQLGDSQCGFCSAMGARIDQKIPMFNRKSPGLSVKQGTARDPKLELELEIYELRRRHANLHRQCLLHYTRRGRLRKCSRIYRELADRSGFQIGAYRAKSHFRRWHNLPRRPSYFCQECDDDNSWRSYRRVLLTNSRPRWNTPQLVDEKRQELLKRMAFLLRMKRIYAEAGAGKLSRQEMCSLMQALERRYLALAQDLHCKLRKLVK